MKAVFLFTLALFLSGYALQQRYVHTLQAAIKPRLPKPLPAAKPILPPTLDVKWARPIGARPDVDETVDQLLARETLDWSRLAYVQVVKEFAELCSAVMLLADLQKLRSPAKRVLMFPRVWLKEGNNDDEYDPHISTTMRLLRTAARRHGVTLVPMETIIDGADGTASSSIKQQHQLTRLRVTCLVILSRQSVFSDQFRKSSLPRGSWCPARRICVGLAVGVFKVGAYGGISSHARAHRHVDVAPLGPSISRELPGAEGEAVAPAAVGSGSLPANICCAAVADFRMVTFHGKCRVRVAAPTRCSRRF